VLTPRFPGGKHTRCQFLVACYVARSARQLPLQGSQGRIDIAAHLGREHPHQWPAPALYLNPFDHPDVSLGDRLEQVVEDVPGTCPASYAGRPATARRSTGQFPSAVT